MIPSQRLFDASCQEENRDLLDAFKSQFLDVKKKFSWGSQKNPHPCTDQAQCCLTLVINSIFGCVFGYWEFIFKLSEKLAMGTKLASRWWWTQWPPWRWRPPLWWRTMATVAPMVMVATMVMAATMATADSMTHSDGGLCGDGVRHGEGRHHGDNEHHGICGHHGDDRIQWRIGVSNQKFC